MNAYHKHKRIVSHYLSQKRFDDLEQARKNIISTSTADILKDHHKFIRDDENISLSWEQRLAKKYYDKLFKEYVIVNLSKYKEGKIAMRWRTSDEVISGKGQFQCASTNCSVNFKLKSWEVNFGYIEHGEKNNQLVKVRLCCDCSDKMNYKKLKEKKKREKREREEAGAAAAGDEIDDSQPSSKRKKDVGELESSSSKKRSRKEKIEKEEEVEIEVEESVWKSKDISNIIEEKTLDDEFDDFFASL